MSSKRHTFAAAIATMFAATCWATLNGQTGGYSSSANRANSLSGTYELDRSGQITRRLFEFRGMIATWSRWSRRSSKAKRASTATLSGM